MGKTAFGLCCARRVGILLVAILGVCICSVGLSVFYVHSVQLSPATDVFHTAVKEWSQIQHRTKDDDSGIGGGGGLKQHATSLTIPDARSGGNPGSVQSLNNIDIALHIEETKKEAHSSKRRPNGTNNKGSSDNKVPLIKNREASLSKRKKDYWPTHIKAHKIIDKVDRISDPLYEKPLRTRENWNGERYITYLCHSNMTCAGWGDRQHGIFSAYLIALVTNRTFKVDLSSPCPLTKLYHPRIANWKVEPSEFEGLSSTHVNAINDREFRESMKEIDFNQYFPQDVVYLTTNYDYYYSLKANPHYTEVFHKKVRNRPRPILFADLWQSIFKHNKRVVRRYTQVLDKARVSDKHKLVCAHIRFGRNPSIPNDGDIRNTFSSIKPLWSFLKKHSDPDRYRLFVASDWEGFRNKVNKFYKNIVVNMEGKVIHIDKYTTEQHTGDRPCNQSCAGDSEILCDGLEMVIADQYVLSKCDILLLTYSVFGKSAAYLRRSNKDLYLMDKGQISSLVLFNERFNKH